MELLARVCAFTIAGAMVSGCVIPAPGAKEVTITRKPADVSTCTPVGNIGVDDMNNLDPVVAQNKAVGLNANVILDTGAGGVAYHCDKKGRSVQ